LITDGSLTSRQEKYAKIDELRLFALAQPILCVQWSFERRRLPRVRKKMVRTVKFTL
jgi:hypothetical protein